MKAARVKLNDAQGGKSQDGSLLKGRIFKWKILGVSLSNFTPLNQWKNPWCFLVKLYPTEPVQKSLVFPCQTLPHWTSEKILGVSLSRVWATVNQCKNPWCFLVKLYPTEPPIKSLVFPCQTLAHDPQLVKNILSVSNNKGNSILGIP